VIALAQATTKSVLQQASISRKYSVSHDLDERARVKGEGKIPFNMHPLFLSPISTKVYLIESQAEYSL
jgi:hypothetical protein